mgnify:FL=1
MNLYKILPALLILSLLAACSSDKENDVYTTCLLYTSDAADE